MLIIQLNASAAGQHDIQEQPHRRVVWLPGYVEVPEPLRGSVWATRGFCALTVEDGALTAVTPKDRPAIPEPEPTAEERLRADVDYLAAMGGVDL